MQIDEVVQRLKEGNSRYIAGKTENKLPYSKLRQSLTGGQSPFAIVLGCADSRVVPELIFDTGLGEIFTVRVAGNVANSSSIASIEFAVASFKPRVIIILSHEKCGAVESAIDGGDNGPLLNNLLSHITPAVKSKNSPDIISVTKRNAKNSAKELASKSQIINKAVKSGQLKIFSAYYSLANGEVEFMES